MPTDVPATVTRDVRAPVPCRILPAMIPYGVYRLVHFFGIFLLLTALGGGVMRAILTASPVPESGTDADRAAAAARMRRLIAISHGVALLLILLGGFGMLARLDIGFPAWIVAKLAVWLLLGAGLTLATRMAGSARLIWFAIPVLGLVAAWLAYVKPF